MSAYPAGPSTKRPSSGLAGVVLLALTSALFVGVAGTAAASTHEGSATIPSTSQTLDIRVDVPVGGASVDADAPLAVSGVVGLDGASTLANALYMVDVSASTTSSTLGDCDGSGTVDAGDDLNGDGSVGDILDCEIGGVLALNDSLVGDVSVGLGAFGTYAALADINPGDGTETFTNPPGADADANEIADLEQVARSLQVGTIGEFVPVTLQGRTDYGEAVAAINTAFATKAGETNVAFMLSDGRDIGGFTSESPELLAAIDAGTIINTYAVGTSVVGQCGSFANLGAIAEATGGSCTEVADPSTLSSTLSGVAPVGIDRVEVELDGAAPVSATLDALGNWSANLDISGLASGTHTLDATVYADDPDNTTATASISVEVAPSPLETLDIRVDVPVDGASVDADAPLAVSGVAGMDGTSTSANALYMVDVSGSTASLVGDCDGTGVIDADDDTNRDGSVGDILDCEIGGVLALNDNLLGDVSVGLGAFGSSAAIADIDPGPGTAMFTNPSDADADADGTADLEEVARSLQVGTIGEFSPVTMNSSTNYGAAVAAINTAFATKPGEANVAFMLSDGRDLGGFAPELSAAVAAGTVINTYAVGTSVVGQCGSFADLGAIAEATGGSCTEVADPSTLSSTLSDVAPVGIDRVEVELDGATPVVATLDALGNWSATLDTSGLTSGAHTIVATVYANDPDSTTATASITVVVEGEGEDEDEDEDDPTPSDPSDKDACKNGGHESFGFRNQGQCIRFVNTGKDSR